MIDKAIMKITEESQAIDDSLSVFMEEYLTNKCTSEAVAKKLLADGKSLAEIHKATVSKARKKAVKGQAHVSDQEICDDLDDYYDLGHQESAELIDIMDLI